MTTITIELTNENLDFFGDYAKSENKTLSDIINKVLEEKIDDEIDMYLVKKFENSDLYDDTEYTSHEEMLKEVGL